MSRFFVSTDRALLDYDFIIQSLQGSYWADWQTKAQILKAFDKSLVWGAYEVPSDNPCQVGFARVVSDGAAFSSITDVLVAENFRRIGIGTMLMQEIIKHPAVSPTICILGTRDAPKFYEKFGFKVIPKAVATVMGRDPDRQ